MEPIIAWLLKGLATPAGMIAALREVVLLVKEFQGVTKGQSKVTKKQARERAIEAAKKQCEGVGCPTGLK